MAKSIVKTGSSFKDIVSSYDVFISFPSQTKLILNWKNQLTIINKPLIGQFCHVLENNYLTTLEIGAIIGMDILKKTHLTINQEQLVINF